MFPEKRKLKADKQGNYLTAKEPEQRVAHIPPMVAPGPAFQQTFFMTMKPGDSADGFLVR